MLPAKIQISPSICSVWSESVLGAILIAKDEKLLHADNEAWSDCADVQSDLSLRCAYVSEGTFSHVVVHFIDTPM